MKKLILSILVVLAAASVAIAQTTPPVLFGGDVLGAHNGYGRGCVMCHAPHSGSLGNGAGTTKDTQNGMYALWGQNLTPLFGAVFNFSGDGAAKYSVTLPSNGGITSAHDANTVILFCLSCHDGDLATVGMMKGQTVETLPIVGGTAPTLLGAAHPSGGGEYTNDHPVGGNAVVSCGGGYNWDCAGGGATATPIMMTGAASKVFVLQYPASFWNSWNSSYTTYATAAAAGSTCGTAGTSACTTNPLATFGTTVNAVTCTTCHDQHSMNVYTNSASTNWTTMFFIRGQYNPYSGGNNVAQFCRNCHGGESNEMHGLMSVPTT